jgi:hypothetical protein
LKNEFEYLMGTKMWAFAAGHIPLTSTGKEPEFTSHDKISLLNTSESDAEILINVFYDNDDPVTGYKIKVPARRVRKVRLNDLIDPFPIKLDRAFALIVTSNVELIIQFTRMDTGSGRSAAFCVTPFSLIAYDE